MIPLILRGASAATKLTKGANIARNISKPLKAKATKPSGPGGSSSGGSGGGDDPRGGSIILRPRQGLVRKTISASTLKITPVSSMSGGKTLEEKVKSIKRIVIDIDSILKKNLSLRKRSESFREKYEEQRKRKERESELEAKNKKPKSKKNNKKKARIPGQGFLSGIIDFFLNMFLGWATLKLVDYIPAITNVLKYVGYAVDWLIDFSGKLLNGLTTFIDWGVQAHDWARNNIGKIFGETGTKVFDTFISTLSTAINLALIAMMVGLNPFNRRGSKGGGQRGPTSRPGKGGRPKVTRSGGGGAGRPDIRNPLRQRPTVTQGGKGPGGFGNPFRQGPRITTTGGQSAGGIFKNLRFPKINFKSAFQGIKGLGVGLLLDYLMNLGFGKLDAMQIQGIVDDYNRSDPARKKKMLDHYEKLIKQYEGKTQGISGAFDSFVTLGGLLGESTNSKMLRKFQAARAAMLAQSAQGYYGGGFVGMESGGMVPSGEESRDIKYELPPKETPQPKSKKVEEFYLTEEVITKSGKTQRKPVKFLGAAIKEFSDIDFLSPMFNIFSKTLIGENISQTDYRKVGLGLNSWFANALNKDELSDLDVIRNQEFDISKWAENSTRELIHNKVSNVKHEFMQQMYDSNRISSLKEGLETLQREAMGQDIYGTTGPSGVSGDEITMARNLMRDLKLTEAQAAGIVGNMIAESGVENARPQNTPPGTKGPLVVDGVTGYGIVQWTSAGRQKKLADFAESRGADLSKPLPMDIEYAFFLKELREDYGHVLQQIKEAKDVKTASTIFMQQYEIPAGYRTEAKIMERYNLSKPVFDKLKSGQGAATLGPSTYGTPDLSSVERGDPSSAAQKLLKDFPQIKSRGSNSQIFASGLGYWLKKNFNPPESARHRAGRGDFGDPGGGDMEHPDHGGVVARHGGTGHYRGVALDLGANSADSPGYKGDQKYLWPYIAKFLKTYGLDKEPYVPQVIHGTGESFAPRMMNAKGPDSGHRDHFHVEFHKGGLVPGEKGKELVAKLLRGESVFDIDTTDSLDKTYPGLRMALNQASNRREIEKAISDYTSYESPHSEVYVIEKEVNGPRDMDGTTQDDYGAYSRESSFNYDPFEILERLPG